MTERNETNEELAREAAHMEQHVPGVKELGKRLAAEEPEWRPATEQEKEDWILNGPPAGQRYALFSGLGLMVEKR